MDKLRVAVIGIGNMGINHVRVYHELDDVELVAIADVNKDNLKKATDRFPCKGYRNYKEMIEKEDVDLISIVVPTSLHKKVALEVIEKGIHFLLEKPIADNMDDAKAIVRKAKEKKLKFLIGHIERFNPAVSKLKKIIDEKRLGNIITISAKRVGIAPPQIKDANIIIDVSIHDIDIINHLFGKMPNKIFANGGKALKGDREDFVDVLLNYGKSSGTIQSNWITPIKIRNLTVTGTKGYAELGYINQELVLYKTQDKGLTEEDYIYKQEIVDKVVVGIIKNEPLKLEIKHIIKCIKDNLTPMVTGEQALKALDVALKINELLKSEKD